MGILNRILSLFPSYKWCGCSTEIGNDSEYQFRVKANDVHGNVFQIREKRVCTQCDEENIEVVVEDPCDFEPKRDIHDRKVGVDEDDMKNYGFMGRDEFARMLIELRLSHSLEPQYGDS